MERSIIHLFAKPSQTWNVFQTEYGVPGRAWISLPDTLEYRPSMIPKAGLGVFSKTFISRYTCKVYISKYWQLIDHGVNPTVVDWAFQVFVLNCLGELSGEGSGTICSYVYKSFHHISDQWCDKLSIFYLKWVITKLEHFLCATVGPTGP